MASFLARASRRVCRSIAVVKRQRALHIGADIWPQNITGAHIESYYSRTAIKNSAQALHSNVDCEVCVIGGGLAGINTANSLAERGVKVVLLEANKLGWAASGRNGGFAHPGYSLDLFSLAKLVGASHARALWELSVDSVDMMRARIAKWQTEGRVETANSVQPGMVVCSWFDNAAGTHAEVVAGNSIIGSDYWQFWDRSTVRQKYNTNKYYDAVYDPAAFHFHSLNYALEVARDARTSGACMYEGTAVLDVSTVGDDVKKVRTAGGTVTADQVVICGSAYMPSLKGADAVCRSMLPIMTYACVTEPLGDKLADVMTAPHAVTDSRFACDYYRPLPDSSILWGGRIDVLGIAPEKLAGVLHADMCKVYPQLRDVKIAAAWPGVMGYARHKMPLIGKLPNEETPGVWYCTGFGGHGVCATTIAGDLVASAIAGGDQRYHLFKPFGLQWAGGPVLGAAAAQAFYWGYEMRDKLNERRINRATL